MLGQQHHIFRALAQRRQRESDDCQPMEQIAPEPSTVRRLRAVLVGRGDDLHFDLLGARAAQTPHRLLFDDLEQLGLERARQQRHFVEEQRPAVRGVKQPGLGLPRIGEGAALEPEQLGFQQRVGDGRTAHVDERAGAPGAVAVDQPREEPFAGAGLALQQDRGKTLRVLSYRQQLLDLLAYLSDRSAHPKQLVPEDHSAILHLRCTTGYW